MANMVRRSQASPKQQIAGRLTWNATRPPGQADFFTLGYSGRKIEEIVAALQEHRVRTLADIRRNPVSMHRPEMSKTNLTRILEEQGIAYVHLPQLGVPSDVRAHAAEKGGSEEIWQWYDKHLETLDPRGLLDSLTPPVALMCTELDPHDCHRHRLCLALELRGLHSYDL